LLNTTRKKKKLPPSPFPHSLSHSRSCRREWRCCCCCRRRRWWWWHVKNSLSGDNISCSGRKAAVSLKPILQASLPPSLPAYYPNNIAVRSKVNYTRERECVCMCVREERVYVIERECANVCLFVCDWERMSECVHER